MQLFSDELDYVKSKIYEMKADESQYLPPNVKDSKMKVIANLSKLWISIGRTMVLSAIMVGNEMITDSGGNQTAPLL